MKWAFLIPSYLLDFIFKVPAMEMMEKVKAVSKECWDIYLICYFHVVLFSFVFFFAYLTLLLIPSVTSQATSQNSILLVFFACAFPRRILFHILTQSFSDCKDAVPSQSCQGYLVFCHTPDVYTKCQKSCGFCACKYQSNTNWPIFWVLTNYYGLLDFDVIMFFVLFCFVFCHNSHSYDYILF